MSNPGQKPVSFSADDFDLFARYHTVRSFDDVPAPDKAHYKSIRDRLERLAGSASNNYSSVVPMQAFASSTNPYGKSVRDLWCCTYPRAVQNKSFGLQFALILNEQGAEFCFCLGAGESDIKDRAKRIALRNTYREMKTRLANLDQSLIASVGSSIGSEWNFREKWRMPPGSGKFSDLQHWIDFASSSEGNGASISYNIDAQAVLALGDQIESEFLRLAEPFKPLFDAVYASTISSPDVQPEPSAKPAAWIFQSNPKLHNLEAMLRVRSEFSWLVAQYGKLMSIGDQVFLWEAGPNAGLVAIAEIQSTPALMEEDPEEAAFNLVQDKFTGKKDRVKLKVASILKRRLLRKTLLDVPELSNLSILRFANNTNFIVSQPERETIFRLIGEVGTVEPPSPVRDKATTKAVVPYTIDDIIKDGCFLPKQTLEAIIERINAKKNVILQGPPGTGKTWLAKRLGFALVGAKDENKIRAVQFHPNLSYEDFVRGWRPSSSGKLSLVDGVFKKTIDAARSNPDSKYVFVIEEINRGNPANIFGELLTLLEDDKRKPEYALELAYPDADDIRRPVYVPPNLYVIGTMNIADRSLALVDLAFRRRFAFIDLEPVFESSWRDWIVREGNIDPNLVDDIRQRITTLNGQIASDARLGRQFRVGHSFLTPATKIPEGGTREWFLQVVKTELAPLLEEYWFDAPDEARKASEKLMQGW